MTRRMTRDNSIRKKLLIPMAVTMILQAVVFTGAILWGGTIDQINKNAFDILNERVINRKNYLENEMLQRWINVGETVNAVHGLLPEGTAAFYGGAPDEQLDAISRRLIYMMRRNSVSGAFIVFDGPGGRPAPGETIRRQGVYIRDLDPTSYPANNSDLLIERAPAHVAQALDIPLDTPWRPQFRFTGGNADDGSDFYYKPFEAALAHPEIDCQNLGYWSLPFKLERTDISVITYSVPLRAADGVPYGVLGVELSLDYLRSLIPYDELGDGKSGSYLLAVSQDGGNRFVNVLSSGPAYIRLFGDAETTTLASDAFYKNSYRVAPGKRGESDVFGCVQYFRLYNSNTPFEGDEWALIGISEADSLFYFSRRVRTLVLAALAVSIVLGAVGVWLTGSLITRPIIALVGKLRASDPRRPVRLEPIHITEIDELSKAVEQLSGSVADAASRLSQIIGLTGIPVGAFEYKKTERTVEFTERFFEILGLRVDAPDGEIGAARFRELMESLEPRTEENLPDLMTRVYRIDEGRETRWARVKAVEDGTRVLGVALDITRDIREKRKIERERDYDVLTGLLNRRAFLTQMDRLFLTRRALGCAALVMLDLDNLKYINDTYGHDYGDEYIRCAAGALKKYSPGRSLISRMSGDEFHIFVYGYGSKEEIRELLSCLHAGLQHTDFPLPDGRCLRVRASAGIAWYPDDSESYDLLMKYADFAMYRVKNTIKGEFNEFDEASYQRDSYLLRSKEELNRLIDEQLVEYHFQPIVRVCDGEPFAYEALMRSAIPTLKSPAEILTLARSQSKLHQIERLTMFKSLDAFEKLKTIPPDCKLFVNSIANQTLSKSDIQELETKFRRLLPRVVIELTEDEKPGEDCTRVKKEFAARWNAEIALDDFGAGYNGDAVLLRLAPDYVKVDMSIVRNIDSDPNRQMILRNLLSYAREHEIRVVAEGVETGGEVRALVALGVDYLQGYYLSMPAARPRPIVPEIRELIVQAWRDAQLQ